MKATLIYIGIMAAVIAFTYGALRWSGSLILTPITGTVSGTEVDGSAIGSRAPDFDLPDTLGNRVRLSDFSNTPVVAVFWATWQGPSADQVKILDDYLASADNQNLVHIIAIDSEEDQSIVTSFVKRGGYKVPVLVDSHGAATESYAVKSLPTFYFIDASGVIQSIYAGTMSQKMLVDRIERLLQ